MSERFLRFSEVQSKTGLPRSTIYWKIGRGEFPRPVKIGGRAVAFLSGQIEEWMKSRPLACEREQKEAA